MISFRTILQISSGCSFKVKDDANWLFENKQQSGLRYTLRNKLGLHKKRRHLEYEKRTAELHFIKEI